MEYLWFVFLGSGLLVFGNALLEIMKPPTYKGYWFACDEKQNVIAFQAGTIKEGPLLHKSFGGRDVLLPHFVYSKTNLLVAIDDACKIVEPHRDN